MSRYYLKAQMSILIIIAIIIVLGSLLIFFLNFDKIPGFEDEKSSYKVKQYVEDCLKLEASNGINKIAQSGGWLYHPPMTFTDSEKPSIFNKRTQGFSLFSVKKPYWFYYDDSEEIFRFNIPSFDGDSEYSLKNQIKRYLDDNLEKNCIQSFKVFEDYYKINYEPKEIKTKVDFNGENIFIDLNLELEILEINTKNTEYVNNFKQTIYNDLKIPYHLARDITMAQANEAFIEKRIMQFLNPYMDSDSRDLLPPKYEFKMEYDFRPWEVKKVENLVKQIIESNINQIQFVDTNYQLNILPKELSNSAFAKGAQKMHLKEYYLKEYSFVYENDKNLYNSYKDYSVEPTFNVFYPFHFNLAPAAGNMVLLPKPQAVINFIPFFFTEYVAVYEMSLPIIFKIDNNQYDKFSFDFAIEANIDYNSPLIETYEYKLNEEYIETRTQSNSLICDPPQFISEYIYLNISDPIINGKRIYDEKKRDFNIPETGVDDAIITFNCKGLSTCFVGQTSINGEFIQNNITQLKFRLPIDCDPGRLEIYKYGHKKLIFNNLNPQVETPILLGTHQMPSKREISLRINILDINKGKFTEGRGLEKEENAFLILENLDDKEIVEVVEINYENQNNLSIKLLPGNYSINSFLLYNDNINIPGGEICFKTSLFGGKECVDLPQIDLESWVSGGIELERVSIDTVDLLRSKEFVVNIIDFGIPSSYETLEDSALIMGDLKLYSVSKEAYFN